MTKRSSISWSWRSRDSFSRRIDKNKWYSRIFTLLHLVVWWTYCPTESLQVAGHHLDLPAVFIALLLGLAQGFCVPIGWICQIIKLCTQTVYWWVCRDSHLSNIVLWVWHLAFFRDRNRTLCSVHESHTVFWPWTGTTPPSRACLRRPWIRTGPWCLSEQQSGPVWTHPGPRAPAGPWCAPGTLAAPEGVFHGGWTFRWFSEIWLKVYKKYHFHTYLLMNLLQEVYLILQGIDLPL